MGINMSEIRPLEVKLEWKWNFPGAPALGHYNSSTLRPGAQVSAWTGWAHYPG